MKLTSKNAVFIFEASPAGSFSHHCPSIAQAQGVLLWECPLGDRHVILIPFEGRGLPSQFEPGLPRWQLVSGTSIENLTIAPSINLDVLDPVTHKHPDCKWHGYIVNGIAE